MLSKKAILVLLLIVAIVFIGAFLTLYKNTQPFNIDFQSKSIVKDRIADTINLNIFGNVVLNPFR